MNKSQCSKCGAALMSYYLKDGVCGGCRNPELVVTSMPVLTNVLLTNLIDIEGKTKKVYKLVLIEVKS